jgi:all-trans-retinol dehydrogenase (NAD+)
MRSLAHKNVIITGGAAGIGKKMALRLARQNANLAVIDIDETGLAHTEKELQMFSGQIRIYRYDLSYTNQIEQAADKIKADFKTIDILINNAGVVTGKPFLTTGFDDLKRNLEINLMAVIWMTRQFLPEMVARDAGHIVNIASAAGLIAVPGLADYCAAKFGVVGFSDALRLEMKKSGHHGVKVSCICPSFIATGMFAGAKPPGFSSWLDPDRVAEKIVQTIIKERAYLKTPLIVKLIPFFKGLPAPFYDQISRIAGLDRAMDFFKGHQSTGTQEKINDDPAE